MGGVDLRRPREKTEIKLHVENKNDRKDVTVTKGWLKDRFGQPGSEKSEGYRISVKQLMTLASTRIELEDLTIVRIDPVTGTWRTEEYVQRKQRELNKTLEDMRQGTATVSRKSLQARENVAKQHRRLEKHVLTKRSKKCSALKKRYFDIEGGRLHVYRSDTHHAKARMTYELKNAKCKFEHDRMPEIENTSGEKFMDKKHYRVVLQCAERPQGPLYLYPDDEDASAAKQAKNWERAAKMSKYLTSQGEKDALETVVKHVTGNVMTKGWDALFIYSSEIFSIKKTVRTFAHRLMKTDMSRGWNKARLVYRKKKADVELKENQKAYAARFLAQRMSSISKSGTLNIEYDNGSWFGNLKSQLDMLGIKDMNLVDVADKDGKAVEGWNTKKECDQKRFPLTARYSILQPVRPWDATRKQMITSIQSKFKHFRQEKIFDRNYALQGSNVTSRSSQAKKGTLMDCAFTAAMNDEAMRMTLAPEQARKEILANLKSKRLTYSETQIGLNRSLVTVPDGACFISFAEVEDGAEHAHLATSAFPSFVNLDQISSVVLHSQRMMAKAHDDSHSLTPDMANGSWMTINGPRICWNRRVHVYQDRQTKEEVKDVLGSSDPMACGKALASGESVKTLSISVQVTSASIPRVKKMFKASDKDETASNASGGESNSDTFETQLVLTLLGRSYMSEKVAGEYPKYSGTFEVKVPIGPDMEALAGLDHQDVSVDIIETQRGVQKTLWAGKMQMWKVFAPESPAAAMLEGVRHLRHRLDNIRNKGIDEEAEEMLIPLSKSLQSGSGKSSRKIKLYHPNDTIGEQWSSGNVQLDFTASVGDAGDAASRPISPELQGCGLTTSLFTSHRGCWFNPKAKNAKFGVDSVGNFVEIKVETIIFPEKDTPDTSKLFKYHIEAKCNGTTVCTKPLVRPKASWNHIIPTDPTKLNFYGRKIYVPIPPGVWSKEEAPVMDIAIMRTDVREMPTLTFSQLRGRPRNQGPTSEAVYHAQVSLEGMVADKKGGNTLVLSKTSEAPSQPKPGMGEWGSAEGDAATLSASIVLRDRDYVRMSMTEKGEDKLAICVGDIATIQCEEPLNYPKDELEFRHRCFPGNFDQGKSKRGGTSQTELREPSMSHEYWMSGLKTLENPGRFPFRQKYIPSNADDVIPYKYVLPQNEVEFEKQGKQGTFWRIMDNLVEQKAKTSKEGTPRAGKYEKMVVEQLTHMKRAVPVSIIAVYANGTCDAEISPGFIDDWELHPDRQYSIPGQVVMKDFEDSSPAWMQQQMKKMPPGTGDISDQGKVRRRVVVKEIPISFLNAVHSASFNVYDARFGTTDEAMAVAPKDIRDSMWFNPRDSDQTLELDPLGKPVARRGGFAMVAGPVPADAGAAAMYEWQLHLRANTEDDLYHFVTMLRHCVRMDFYQQQLKVHDFKQKNQATGSRRYQVGETMTSASGYLEVVLVEARRLRPKMVQKHKDTLETVKHKLLEREFNPQVTFRMLNVSDPIDFNNEMARRQANNTVLPNKVIQNEKYMRNYETVRITFDPSWKEQLGDKLSDKTKPAFVIKLSDEFFNGGGKPMETLFKYYLPGAQIPSDPTPKGSCQNQKLPKDFDRNFSIDFQKIGDSLLTECEHPERQDPLFQFGMSVTRVDVLDNDEKTPLESDVAKVFLLPQSELIYRGSRTQVAPAMQHNNSPNWSTMEEHKSTGGFLFKSPPIDPTNMPYSYFELMVQDKGIMLSTIGCVRVPMTGKIEAPEGGSPSLNLCDNKQPFNNLWLPLCDIHPMSGDLTPKLSGEVHIMTRWVASQQTQLQKRMPRTAKAYFLQELRPKLMSNTLREPIYSLQMRCTYNPNCVKEQDRHPLKRYELIGEHAEQLLNSERYMRCLDGRTMGLWKQFLKKKGVDENVCDGKMGLGSFRLDRSKCDPDTAYDLDERLRRGVPAPWRMQNLPIELTFQPKDSNAPPSPAELQGLWMQITRASEVMDAQVEKTRGDVNKPMLPKHVPYKLILKFAETNGFRTDAKLQMQEDYVKASEWETSQYPNVKDAHLARLKRAKNICSALVTFSYDSSSMKLDGGGKSLLRSEIRYKDDSQNLQSLTMPQPEKIPNYKNLESNACPVSYCESLFVLAFFLCLPQEDDSKEAKQMQKHLNNAMTGMSRTSSNMGNTMSKMASMSGGGPKSDLVKEDGEHEEESRAFWLLYTLIGSEKNSAFRDYFGNPLNDSGNEPCIANFKGVTEDVFHLNSCLTRYNKELWVHMTSVGFNLSSVFHGAFMRWFAFYLPTATLYRFWDLLFSETINRSSGKGKPSRHVLIDLAYGALKACSPVLMSCNSSMEIHDCIVGYLEALYDPSKMIEICTEAERELWEPISTKIGWVPEHMADYTVSTNYYKDFLWQFWLQNQVLLDITRHTEINAGGMMRQAGAPQSQNRQEDNRVTTKNVVNWVILPLRQQLAREKEASATMDKMGMWRKQPQGICELGPSVDSGFLHHVYDTMTLYGSRLIGRHGTHALERFTREDLSRPQAYTMNKLPRVPQGEAGNLDKATWMKLVGQVDTIKQAWLERDCIGRVFDTFESLSERSMSMNEFFVGLICCSKGTVGEKALALFHLYSFYDPPHRLKHIVPMTHATKAVVEKVEGKAAEEGQSMVAPLDEEIPKTTALHFKIHTHTGGNDMLLGEAFVSSLVPFVSKSMGNNNPISVKIWGTKMRAAPGVSHLAVGTDGKVRQDIGDLKVSIKWMPEPGTPEKGQLGIHVHSIGFHQNKIEAVATKNPFIEVVTYDETGHPNHIPRWDPRNFFRKAMNTASIHYAYRGAYGDHIEFAETEVKRMGKLYKLMSEKDHGYDRRWGLWLWNDRWGDQYSTKGFAFKKDFTNLASKPNTISIQACRLLTLAILRRSMHFITNRAAMLVGDEVFSRSGTVPGILDAVIISGSEPDRNFTNPRELIESYTKSGKSFIDCKHQLIIEAEKQCNNRMGKINLWDASLENGKVTMSDLKIRDIFHLQSKLMWVRYVRAGDGERIQVQIPISMGGELDVKPIELDMPETGDLKSHVMTTISKEEFVACMLNNPMLSESLRQVSSSDNTKANTSNPIKLDVTISDPGQTYEDDDLFDALNVRQSILLEIWDHDTGPNRDDFLGECWLPPLGTIGASMKQFALPVVPYDPSNSRPGGTKKELDPQKNREIGGDLIVKASWKLPAKEPEETAPEGQEETLQQRVKREEQLHTGELMLEIVRAEGLRAADMRRKSGSDPYVIAYVKNEAEDPKEGKQWRTNETTGTHEPIFKTGWKRGTINPEWNEAMKEPFLLKTGAFEKRTRKKWALHNIHISQRGRQNQKDQEALKVIADSEKDELKIYFTDPREGFDPKPGGQQPSKDEPGRQHGICVYLGDTIREFKQKLERACELEAEYWMKNKKPELSENYKKVHMSIKHQVTVFVPSEKLRSLAQQGRTGANEYKRLYKLEDSDPSYWNPLDPIRTFQHYQSTYGFGAKQPQRLRINEGTEDYKIRNYRYRQFLADQEEMAKIPADMNEDGKCFGYGLYVHEKDQGSTEWRPCIADRPDGDRFKVDWLYTPKLESAEQGPEATQIRDDKEELEQENLLLAPHMPKIFGSGHLEHQEFLAQAKALHDQGMSDAQIAKELNDRMNKKFEKSKEHADTISEAGSNAPSAKGSGKGASGSKGMGEPPPAITAAEVTHYLRTSADGGKEGRSGVTTPRSGTSEQPSQAALGDVPPTGSGRPAPSSGPSLGGTSASGSYGAGASRPAPSSASGSYGAGGPAPSSSYGGPGGGPAPSGSYGGGPGAQASGTFGPQTAGPSGPGSSAGFGPGSGGPMRTSGPGASMGAGGGAMRG